MALRPRCTAERKAAPPKHTYLVTLQTRDTSAVLDKLLLNVVDREGGYVMTQYFVRWSPAKNRLVTELLPLENGVSVFDTTSAKYHEDGTHKVCIMLQTTLTGIHDSVFFRVVVDGNFVDTVLVPYLAPLPQQVAIKEE